MDRLHNFAGSEPSGSAPLSVESACADPPAVTAVHHAAQVIEILGAEAKQTVSAGATTQFAEWLGWPDWLKQGTGLPSGDMLPDRITIADDLVLIANIIDHEKGAGILARLTEDFRIPGAPISVPALYNAPTLLEALQFYVRTVTVGSPFLKAAFYEEPGRFSIVIDSDIPRGDLRDFVSAAMLSIAYRFVSFFVIDDVSMIELEIEASKEAVITNALTKLPAQFRFDADRYALHGKSAWLGIENNRTDKAFWNFALERLTVAEREARKSDIVRRIQNSVCTMMETERRVPRLKQIAAAEGVSERTLVRALAAQGVKFHQLIEEERRVKACELIGNASISLAEIAGMLGFTDMSSFGRSYRQWFGVTPGQARSRRNT